MVVDLYSNVKPDTYTTIYSCGKSIASILLAMLWEQGLFLYEDQVEKYWPEFSKNGKKATIEQILKHEGGLRKLARPLQLDEMKTENIKKNSIGKLIEDDR